MENGTHVVANGDHKGMHMDASWLGSPLHVSIPRRPAFRRATVGARGALLLVTDVQGWTRREACTRANP